MTFLAQLQLPQTNTGSTLQLPHVQYWALLPVLVLMGGAALLLLFTSLLKWRLPRDVVSLYTVFIGAIAFCLGIVMWSRINGGRQPERVIAGAGVADGFAVFLVMVIAAAVVIGGMIAETYLDREWLDVPEFCALMMLSASGAMLMAMANDLIVVFGGLEILSIALYVMTGFHIRRSQSTEAAMKYFILGAFSSALFLYGIALVYGATGSTNLHEISGFLAGNTLLSNGTLLAGMALLLVGLAFKVGAVPFHSWVPDVYEGSPTPATAFMAAVAKAGAFGALLRIFASALATQRLDWQPVVWIVAVLSLVVGSVVAVVQRDVKRMLAYSSVAHAGYILMGLQAGTHNGVSASLFYVAAYAAMVLGSFTVVMIVGRTGDEDHDLDSYRGLASRRPLLALIFTVLLLAQAGIPLTSGFFAKFYVITAAVQAHSYALAIIAMIAAAIAAFFYLRIVRLMYTPLEGEAPALTIAPLVGCALTITVVFTLVFGIVPGGLIDFARRATIFF